MPEDFIPLYFMSWLANGPASDTQNPLWLPDTGKPIIEKKLDILDSTATSASIGKSSCYSRKMQRLEGQHKSNDHVLDLTTNEDVANELLRESVKNSTRMVSILSGSNDAEKQHFDAMVLNAMRLHELENTSESKAEYIQALREQKNFLNRRAATPLIVKKEVKIAAEKQDIEELGDKSFPNGTHNLDDSFFDETV